MARSAKPRKRKPASQRSKLPRYVVKLHEDDFFDEEDAEVLRFDSFDDAVECCADLNIPFFVDAGNKKLVFWFVRVDDEGYPEIARCTEREFATILSGISAGGMYCPECGTVHWPDGVAPPFRCFPVLPISFSRETAGLTGWRSSRKGQYVRW
ncbi:transposase [Shigella flexneri]|nr:transposase [Shigella flexneri]EJH8753113.1 hypothetical protein [Escherichia coli]EFX9274173.1 transposase [Shigella flexneri]EFX9947058.1 transposase [Shigella flexneri]EGE1844265.1 transposase [Shigella flexneri]EKO4236855.1 hypothetical protein [Shigella flexneri]